MMKRLFMLLLAMLLLLSSALAEKLPLGDYVISLPEDVVVETNETSVTVVRGSLRVVVQAFPLSMEQDAPVQVLNMMYDYNRNMTDIKSLMLVQGVYGSKGLVPNFFGEGEDLLVVIILSKSGVLALSAYDLEKDTERADGMLTELLEGTSLLDKYILRK